MGKLFGTDGARGIANTELTCELAMKIGRAAAMVLTEATHHRTQIVIGKDTRISSDMLEAALTAGICSVGADVVILGVVPTPAVAYLVRKYNADAGIMISASHNPFEYNGIKIFNGDGYKLKDCMEEEIEAIVLDFAQMPPKKVAGEVGRVRRANNALTDYIAYLKGTIEGDLAGLHVAIDCANGSASATAQQLFSSMGAQCEIFNAQPNGININDNCGSTHIESLSEYVRQSGCDVGVAFDGDADRCLAVDDNGEVVDGDKILAVVGNRMNQMGKLDHNTVVGTVYSNIGLGKSLTENGMKLVQTATGDRYVLEEMLKNGYKLGGEQSGHIIFLDHATTGDGQLSALQFLSILKKSGKAASELASVMESYPQVMVNVKVGPDGKDKLDTDEGIQKAVSDAQAELADEGRILVRSSGTEPLIRVMVESRHFETAQSIAGRVADLIQTTLC